MSTPDSRLSLLTFPQRWDGRTGQLDLRIAVLPRTSPLEPLLTRLPPNPNEPPFVKARLVLQAMLIPSLERLPDPADVSDAIKLKITTPANREPLYQELSNVFPVAPAPGTKPEPRRKDTFVKKLLPMSYRRAFAFEEPRTPFAYTDDAYRCALKAPPKAPPPSPAKVELSWGQIIALVLPQPRLAELLGLVYTTSIKLPFSTFFESGGWIYVALAPESDYAGIGPPSADHVKYYAARLPPLKDDGARALFAAVMFPILSGPPLGSYDDNFVDADAYDDGFAKIVHCAQPLKADFLDDSAEALPAVQDAGIQLGWDDEQIAIWLNRQIDPKFATQDSPMSVLGYRVDVRKPGAKTWISLSRVEGELRLGAILNETFKGEHALRLAPSQMDRQRTGDFWLPAYFARWSGKSLVTRDDFGARLADPVATPGGGFTATGLERISLRYGETYEFRVRLVDIAGGGPEAGDKPENPAPAPVGSCPFRRFVPPRQVRIISAVTPLDPDNPQSLFKVAPPLLGYPSLAFTDFKNAEAALLADAVIARADGRETGLPDPDVTTLEVAVEVRDPALTDQATYRTLYLASRAFPAVPGDPVEIELAFEDTKNCGTLPPPAETGPLRIPRARDIRLRLTPVCRLDPTLQYFGSQEVRRGAPTYLSMRASSEDERDLFVPQTPGKRLNAIMLQPDPLPGAHHAAAQAMAGRQQEAPADLAQRLAQQLRLDLEGLTLFGKPGRRVIFGCSPGLRHILGADHSTLTFASKAELTHQWVIALMLQIDRDWTWDALADVGFEVSREITHTLTGEKEKQIVGTIEVPRSASVRGAQNADQSRTDLVFFDAIDPKPAPGSFPAELEVKYTVRTMFKNMPARDRPLDIQMVLPMAAPPAQTPRLVSAGIALSPYQPADDYSATAARQRMLWIEFEEPVQNQRDAFFTRVLASAPDPMLTGQKPPSPPEPAEPPLPVDPELIRVISPGQSDDRAGLDAMQRLVPSDSPRHFLVPLPPGLTESSPELFGFFVNEIRVGHAEGWSTAQSRFGPALRITSVQHPAPPLVCQVARRRTGIVVSAAYAVPVAEGRNLLPFTPHTEIWALFYAQVMQLDGALRRNVLLGRRVAELRRRSDIRETGEEVATAELNQEDIESLLKGLALPVCSALSVLTVELLPELVRPPDPLGADLGHVRILRTSPLAKVPEICV